MQRHNFKNLKIWQNSVDLAVLSYDLTKEFRSSERFNLISQMNRSAGSIASNIAEGTSKSSSKHFILYLENTLGSSYEWQTQLQIARRIGYIDEVIYNQYENEIRNIQKMTSAFIDKIKS